MSMPRLIKFHPLILTLLAFIACIAYAAYISFFDHREFGKYSIDYLLLTPGDLMAIADFCETEPAFIYSSADGPKPTITTLRCRLGAASLNNYIGQSTAFEKLPSGVYSDGTRELDTQPRDAAVIHAVTILDYL